MGALGATSGTGTAGGTTEADTTDPALGGGGALTAVIGTTTGEALARCPEGGVPPLELQLSTQEKPSSEEPS